MATLSVNTVASGGTPLANADLYGLPFDPAPPASPRDPALYFSGPNDTTAGVIKLQEDFLVPDDGAGGTIKLSVDLSSYLNQLYAAGAAPGDFAVLRLSYDIQPVDTTTINRYRFRSGDTAVPEEFKPALEIVTIPEPGMAGLLAIATVPLLGSRRRRSCRPALVERHSDFENGSVIFGAEMNASLSTFLKRGER